MPDLLIRRIPQYASLLVLCGLVCCTHEAIESDSHGGKILHAERFSFLKYTEKEDGTYLRELQAFNGSANQEELSRLEDLFFATPRVSDLVYYLEDETYPIVCGCRESEWIHCTLEDGQVFCLRIRHKGKTVSVYGEPDLRLALSDKEGSEVFDRAGWDEVSSSETAPSPKLDKN